MLSEKCSTLVFLPSTTLCNIKAVTKQRDLTSITCKRDVTFVTLSRFSVHNGGLMLFPYIPTMENCQINTLT